MTDHRLKEEYERKSLQKDGGLFAIARAILGSADHLNDVAYALRALGTADAATRMGAIELLSMEVRKIAEAIEGYAAMHRR